MTQLSQEDKDFLDDFFDKFKNNFSISGEMTLNKIGEYISKMPIGDLQHFGRLFKTYGYYGVMFAIKESLETDSAKPFYKYAIATALVLIFPVGTTALSATLYASFIGVFVGVSWDYIEENQDNLLNKLKELLQDAGINIDDEGNVGTDMESIIRICPMPSKEETQCLIKDAWYMGQSTRSPLVLDIDGDGVETIGTNNGIYFDHDNNGFAENTGWAGADDGLLVRDTNNNGSIDNGTELFGNNTILSSGQNAQNGFDALADLDSNKDGVFNSSDTAWNEVKVWKDSNSDATVNEGELITLENANINAINLSYNEQDVTS